MATEKKFRYKHILSNVEDKAPTSAQILDGEIAVNTFAGSEKMFIKNASGNIVSFSSDNAIGTMISDSISGKADTSAVTESINAATSGKVDTTTFETYSGNVDTAINSKLATSDFNTYSGAVDTAIGSKAAQSDLNALSGTVTGHTADTDIHVTTTEKTNLDSLATNIAAISGITSTKVSNWDTAATSAHNHDNKSALDGITGAVGTMAYENVSSYSSATEVNTALGNKADKADAVVSAVTVSSDLSNVTCPDSITGSSKSGAQAIVIYENGGTTTDYTITVSTNYKSPDGSQISITCAKGGYCEVNYINVNGTIYAIGA